MTHLLNSFTWLDRHHWSQTGNGPQKGLVGEYDHDHDENWSPDRAAGEEHFQFSIKHLVDIIC